MYAYRVFKRWIFFSRRRINLPGVACIGLGRDKEGLQWAIRMAKEQGVL